MLFDRFWPFKLCSVRDKSFVILSMQGWKKPAGWLTSLKSFVNHDAFREWRYCELYEQKLSLHHFHLIYSEKLTHVIRLHLARCSESEYKATHFAVLQLRLIRWNFPLPHTAIECSIMMEGKQKQKNDIWFTKTRSGPKGLKKIISESEKRTETERRNYL